jgi:hypothetical protein
MQGSGKSLTFILTSATGAGDGRLYCPATFILRERLATDEGAEKVPQEHKFY